MKKYDNINYSLFISIVCIVAVLALVFVIAVVAIGVFFSTDTTESDIYETHTRLPQDTEIPQTDETVPPETEPAESEPPVTEAPDTQPPETQQEVPDNTPTPTILGESEDLGQDYVDRIVFLVDATNVGLRTYGVLNGGKNTDQVWRTASGTLTLSGICQKKIIYPQTGAELTVAEAAAKSKPEFLVIALGFEGMNSISSESFNREYTAIIDAIKNASPQTKIILQSVYPIASRVKGKVTNARIDELNSSILSLAQTCNVKYLDTCSVLKNGLGALKEEYDNGGTGWNMNASGFDAVLSYIRTHGYR